MGGPGHGNIIFASIEIGRKIDVWKEILDEEGDWDTYEVQR